MKCLDGQWRARLIRAQAQPKRYNVEKAEDERYQHKLLLRCEVIVEAASRLWCKHIPLRIDRFEQLICNQRKSNGWTLKAICEAKGHYERIGMDSQAVGRHLPFATRFPSESTLEVADGCREASFIQTAVA